MRCRDPTYRIFPTPKTIYRKNEGIKKWKKKEHTK